MFKYRIVQEQVHELNESFNYTEKELKHRRSVKPRTRVVWSGEREKDFEEKYLQDPTWQTSDNWEDEICGSDRVSHFYRLERMDAETQTWNYVGSIQPIFVPY